MAPMLHCVRHAQGYHNLSKENEDKYHDPDLTDRGREQCERLRDNFPYQAQLDCILASPIRRTIQTALIGLEPAIKGKGLKLLLAPRAQETSTKASDTGSDLSKLQGEFGDKIDARRMHSDWNTNEGEWKMDNESIEQHVIEIRRVIKGLKHDHVALVAHGGVRLFLPFVPIHVVLTMSSSYIISQKTGQTTQVPKVLQAGQTQNSGATSSLTGMARI